MSRPPTASSSPPQSLISLMFQHYESSADEFRAVLANPAQVDIVAEIRRSPAMYTSSKRANVAYDSPAQFAFFSCNSPSIAFVLLEFGYDPLDWLVQAVLYIQCRGGVATQVAEIANFISSYREVMTEEMRQKLKSVVNDYPRVAPILSADRPNTHILKSTGTTISLDPSTGKPRKQLPTTLPVTVTPLIQVGELRGKAGFLLSKFLIEELGADINASLCIDAIHNVYSYEFVKDERKEKSEPKAKSEDDEGKNEQAQQEETEEGEESDGDGDDDDDDDDSKYLGYCDGLEVKYVSPFYLALKNGNRPLLEYLLSHPKFTATTEMSPEKVHSLVKSATFFSGSMHLLMLNHFPFLSGISCSSSLASCFFPGVRPESTKHGAKEEKDEENNDGCALNDVNDEKVKDDVGDDDDENSSNNELDDQEPPSRPLDVSNITQEDFEKYHVRVFGKSNPERRGLGDVLIQAMMKCMCGAYALRKQFNETHYDPSITKLKGPIFCYDRYGCSIVCLGGDADEHDDANPRKNISSSSSSDRADENNHGISDTVPSFLKKKYLVIGGEHEDGYDPDFQIYNDIFVFDPLHQTYEMFAYPRESFPPTDFHTATLVPHLGCVFIIGNVGYGEDRIIGYTPIYRLDLTTMKIVKVETKNEENFVSPVDEKTLEMFVNPPSSSCCANRSSTSESKSNCGPGWISEHVSYFVEDQNEIVVSGGKILLRLPLTEHDIEMERKRRLSRRQNWEAERAAENENAKEQEQGEGEKYTEDPIPTFKNSFDTAFMNDKKFYLNIDTLIWRWEILKS